MSATTTTNFPCAPRSPPDDHRPAARPAAGPAGRRSPAPTSAAKPASTLPAGARRPVFEDDLWDFTDVIGLPVQMALANRRFDFTAITTPAWRLVAKELILAMLAPRHEAVRLCRAPTAPRCTCYTAVQAPGRADPAG